MVLTRRQVFGSALLAIMVPPEAEAQGLRIDWGDHLILKWVDLPGWRRNQPLCFWAEELTMGFDGRMGGLTVRLPKAESPEAADAIREVVAHLNTTSAAKSVLHLDAAGLTGTAGIDLYVAAMKLWFLANDATGERRARFARRSLEAFDRVLGEGGLSRIPISHARLASGLICLNLHRDERDATRRLEGVAEDSRALPSIRLLAELHLIRSLDRAGSHREALRRAQRVRSVYGGMAAFPAYEEVAERAIRTVW